MDKLTLRPALRGDAADLAILDNIAGHGISNWFWQGAVNMGKAEDAYDWGRTRMLDDEAEYGWKNAIIAERAGVTLGSCCSYLMPDDDAGADEEKTPTQFKPVMDLFQRAQGHWFVDSLAVYANARGQGVGAALLDDALQRGRSSKVGTFSLVAEDSNAAAMRLYKSRGMRVADRRAFIPFGSKFETKNWLLLSVALKEEES